MNNKQRKGWDWYAWIFILTVWFGFTALIGPEIPEKLSEKVYQESNSKARKLTKAGNE